MLSEDKKMTFARFVILVMMGLTLLIGSIIGIIRDVMRWMFFGA
jgi:hypothetical protein